MQVAYGALSLLFYCSSLMTQQGIYYKNASELLNRHRFSVMGKYIFVKNSLLGVKSQWASEIYQAHLYGINKCSGDGQQLNVNEEVIAVSPKNNIEDYKRSFYALMHSMQEKGFDPTQSVIFQGQHTILDGEHRLACSLYLQLPVPCKKSNQPDWMHSYSSNYLKGQRVSEKYLDAMALEYAKLKNNTYIVSLFSKARNKDDQVRSLLNSYGSVIYEKEVILVKEGPFNLMKLFYMGEPWFGTWENNFPGAYGKGSACFNLKNNSYPIRVFLWECDGLLEQMRECKKRIRSLFGLHNDSVHINDTHEETVRYAQAYFNKNSLHFLNHAKPKKFTTLLTLTAQYKKWLQEQHIDTDCLCIDSSAILSAYGIRDCGDLDIIHHGYDDELKVIPYKGIGSHNDELRYHAVSKDEIIFNPEYHFYFNDLKFASLDVVKRMKQKRNEPKDRSDVAAIKQYE